MSDTYPMQMVREVPELYALESGFVVSSIIVYTPEERGEAELMGFISAGPAPAAAPYQWPEP